MTDVSGHLQTNWRRLNGTGRIAGIDLARGLAIIGMFAAHLLALDEGFSWTDASTWGYLVEGRSSILFATLAGVSIGIVSGGRTPVTGTQMTVVRWRLALRAAMLFLLGILLILTGVPVYVILPAYAVLFLIALPFTSMTAATVLGVAGSLAVLMPFLQPLLNALPFWQMPGGSEADAFLGWHYPFTVWIAFVLAGLGIARSGITRAVVQMRMLVSGAVLAACGYGAAVIWMPTQDGGYWSQVWTEEPHSAGLLEVIGSGGFAVAVIAACLLLCRIPLVKAIVLPLRATGAMPLTAYVMQIVLWAIIAAVLLGDTGDLMGFRAMDPFWPFVIGTIAASTAWALLIGRGPFEWLLDRAATRVVPAPAAGRLER